MVDRQDYFYAGATTLAEQLDKTVLAILRDGRHVIGRLISFDHFGSLVLQDVRERHIAGRKMTDVEIGGLYVLRGENLALLAEIDEAADAANPMLERAETEEVLQLEADASAAADAAAPPGSAAARVASANRLPGVAATIPQIWSMGE